LVAAGKRYYLYHLTNRAYVRSVTFKYAFALHLLAAKKG
jgi:hypothetical protein